MTKEKIDEAAAVYEAHLGPGLFNYDGRFIAALYTQTMRRCVAEFPKTSSKLRLWKF